MGENGRSVSPSESSEREGSANPNLGSRVCKSSVVYICISLISFDCCEIKKTKTKTDLSSHWWASWDLVVGSSVLVKWGGRLIWPWADIAGSSGMCRHAWLATALLVKMQDVLPAAFGQTSPYISSLVMFKVSESWYMEVTSP